MNRRGISQVVTTLLFVLIALGAVLLVWNLVRGIITQSSEDIDVTQFNLKYSLEGKNLYVNEELGSVSFIIKRDAGGGEAEIRSINVVLEDSTGQSANYVPEEDVVIGELESKRIDINYKSLGLVDVVKVGVAPVLVANDGSDKLGNVLVEYNVGEDRVGHYLIFSGAGDSLVNVSNSDSLYLDTVDFSVSVWAKVDDSLVQSQLMVNKADMPPGAVNSKGWSLFYRGGSYGYRFDLNDGNSLGGVSASFGGIDTNLHHLVATVDRSDKIKTYIDGVLYNSKDVTLRPNGIGVKDSLNIGDLGSYLNFKGTMDDVRIYNKALDVDEVLDIYDDGDLGGSVASGNLVGWWKFDEGSGDTAKDSSGNGNNGVISGATYSN